MCRNNRSCQVRGHLRGIVWSRYERSALDMSARGWHTMPMLLGRSRKLRVVGRTIVAAAALVVSVAAPSGQVLATRSGSTSYNGCVATWSNNVIAADNYVRATTTEQSGCARVRARVYFQHVNGQDTVLYAPWDSTVSNIIITGVAEIGYNSRHYLDNDLSGSIGYTTKGF